MEPPQQGKLLRAPSLKRGKTEESDRFQLNHVIGVTVTNNSALACDPNSNLIAYPSGCTIILHNTKIGYQQAHLVNTCRKTVTSLAFSTDGRYLVTGECGHAPCVRIWDLQNDTASNSTSSVLNCGTSNVAIQVAEFQAHQYGVNCVAFSPSNKYVVSVGSQHDMIVNVWDWKNNVKVASNKVSTKVKAIAFAENGSYFVTVGNRHIKFWYLEYSRNTKYKETVPLVGRAAILGSQQGQNFVAVACGRGDAADNTYAVTRSGLLCQLNNRRLLDKWLELRTTSANCMAVGENFIFVGCADGIVRCFNPSTLHFVTTLPRTHHLGVDVSEGLDISHMSRHPNNAKYPDTVAVAYDESNHKLTCIYNDHSIYVWDVRDIKRVGKSQSYLYHSACIWGIEMYPNQEETSLYGNHGSSILPEGSFITCSSDDTIRIWNLNTVGTGQTIRRNIYSNELLKVIYVDPELNYIKDQDLTSTGNNDKIDVSYDGKNGVRCIRIRPDGLHLASGDRAGNIRIHDMKTLQEIYKIEAHDAEVLCLEYSKCIPGENDFPRLLASASRDRLIHVFNVDDGYSILQTLDDHSSSITAVRFVNVGQQLKMISCGADKSIIFRNLNMVPGIPSLQFQRGQNVAGRTTLYDMETEVTGRHVLTVCQDRAVRIYSTRSGRYVRSLRGSPSEDGSLIKVTLDASGRYMATSCTDKTLSIYCAWSGQLLAYVCGHSELVTGLRFTHNGDQLISASGDAGILIWKHTQRKPYNISTEHETDGEKCNVPLPDIIDPNANISATNYRFSIGPLPLWAKKQINEDVPQLDQVKSLDYPKGRWAQRVEQGGITVKSVYDSDSIIPFPNPQDTIHDSDASKDSSIDSGTESRNFSEYRKETATVKFKQSFNSSSQTVTMTRGIGPRPSHHTDDSSLGSMLGSSAIGGDTGDSAAEHDGDVEDCSDAEGLRRSTNINSSITNTKFYPDAGSAIDSPSEFTVNAMSVDELRKSQRKNKNKRLELPLISISTTSVSGSQESDFDDDDASTPSGDNTDKNPISLLSASIESLDTIGQRTKYLQSAFDSLSGAEQEISPGKTTLSALHHNTRTNSSHETPPRNISVANSVTQGKNENEAYKTREELTRIVAETRRKLQSVGFKSNLKSSQSTMDLRRIPDKETRIEQKRNTISMPLDVDSENNLRRACSLSDLTDPSPIKHKSTSAKNATKPAHPVRPAQAPSTYVSRHNTNSKVPTMVRSSSVGILNQSESESDFTGTIHAKRVIRSNLMRPTISSQNKATNVNKNTIRRRGIQSSYSTANLTMIGNEDSSSDDQSTKANGSSRTRPVSIDHTTVNQWSTLQRRNKDSANPKSRVNRGSLLQEKSLDNSLFRDLDQNVDLTTSQLSTQLCNQIAEQLTRTADNVVQLYRRLTLQENDNTDTQGSLAQDPSEKSHMLENLESAILETQRTLQQVVKRQRENDEEGVVDPSTPNHDQTVDRLRELATMNSSGDPTKFVLMMQQYSDILLNMMRMQAKN